jgi:hypothetical protein
MMGTLIIYKVNILVMIDEYVEFNYFKMYM